MSLKAGLYNTYNPYMVHRGREISVQSLELELTPTDSGRWDVFATAHLTVKLLGLDPGEKDIQVFFELEGGRFSIVDATVFDLDLHPSGETSVQIMGQLVELQRAGPRGGTAFTEPGERDLQ